MKVKSDDCTEFDVKVLDWVEEKQDDYFIFAAFALGFAGVFWKVVFF